MTTTTETKTPELNAEQSARVAALNAAKIVLGGTSTVSLFGQAAVERKAPADLIELADYIIGEAPKPKGLTFLEFLSAMAEQDGVTLHGPDCQCDESVADPDEDPAVRVRRARMGQDARDAVEQAEAVARNTRARQEEFWAGAPERAAKLRADADAAEAAATTPAPVEKPTAPDFDVDEL